MAKLTLRGGSGIEFLRLQPPIVVNQIADRSGLTRLSWKFPRTQAIFRKSTVLENRLLAWHPAITASAEIASIDRSQLKPPSESTDVSPARTLRPDAVGDRPESEISK